VSELAVDVQDVSKRFRLHHERYTSLKERAIHMGRVPYEDLWALRDISFEVNEGETVGILGRNGSGKSTLLKCVCGVLQPTSGQVVVRGKLAGLLELGAGFQQELSGRDNIYLNGSMLGMSKRDVDRVFDSVVAFAELEQFIDNQVKFYSSGMYVRLGFAVAVNVDPDVLVVDEVLAVGDERFQRKCMDKIKSFQEEGRTILFVSHSPDLVRSICDRAVVLSDGIMIASGTPGEAVRVFRENLLEKADVLSLRAAPAAEGAPSDVPSTLRERSAAAASWERPIRLGEIRVQYPGVSERPCLLTGQALAVQIAFEASRGVESLVFTLEIMNANDDLILRTDSDILGYHFNVLPGEGMVEFVFDSFPLTDGAFDVNVGVQSRLGGDVFDLAQPGCRFEVINPGRETGVVALPTRVNMIDGGYDVEASDRLVAGSGERDR
jgi:ABC-2 type transport system ATP-binding protein